MGYQAVGSIGRILQDGAKEVRIDGMKVKVRARVAMIEGYSGHTDRDGLMDFVAHGGEHIEKVFVTMGEEKASLFLVQRLRDFLKMFYPLPVLAGGGIFYTIVLCDQDILTQLVSPLLNYWLSSRSSGFWPAWCWHH